MGSDVTVDSLKWGLADRVRPLSKMLLATRAAGQDAKEIDLDAVPGRKASIKKGGQKSFVFGLLHTIHIIVPRPAH